MKSCLFPPGCVALVVNSLLFSPPALAARTATQAGSRLPEFPAVLPATPSPDEKVHRFHLARYNLGLVLERIWPTGAMTVTTTSSTPAARHGINSRKSLAPFDHCARVPGLAWRPNPGINDMGLV